MRKCRNKKNFWLDDDDNNLLKNLSELSGKTQRRGFHLDNLLKWETFMRLYLIFVFSPLVIIGIYRFSLIIWN